MVLDLDLNDPPPDANVFLMSNPISVSTNWVQVPDIGSQAQATTDIEHGDDEVVICSPRSFAEAREKSRRNRELIEVLEETESLNARSARLSSSGNRRRKAPSKRMTNSNNLCIDLERHETVADLANEKVVVPQQLPQPVPQPPAFSCPVCRGPFVEETSTKCGHIFCKKCISASIAAQRKCPTCRQKLKAKDTLRVYLPISE